MKICETREIKIYLGLRRGYGSKHYAYDIAEKTIRDAAPVHFDLGCVTVTRTKFYYVNGWERGVIIGLINYPRFPSKASAQEDKAIEFAKWLGGIYGQERISVMGSKTTMLEKGIDY
jgi:hypothetical protein